MKKIRWTMTDVIEGTWPEVSFHLHRWQWGISVEVFFIRCDYAIALGQEPPVWAIYFDEYLF